MSSALISKYFTNHAFYYQKATFSSLLVPEAESKRFIEFSGDYYSITAQSGIAEPHYHICLASDSQVPDTVGSCFEIVNVHQWEKDLLQRETDASCREAELKKLINIVPLSVYRFVRALIRGGHKR